MYYLDDLLNGLTSLNTISRELQIHIRFMDQFPTTSYIANLTRDMQAGTESRPVRHGVGGLASTGARKRSERPRRSRPPHGRTAGRLCSGDALSVRVVINCYVQKGIF